MKKIITAILFVIFLSVFLYALGACKKRNDLTRDLVFDIIRGPSGVGLVRLFEQPPEIDGFNVKMEALANADLAAARLISGEAKAGILPPNMAAKIASSGIDIRAAAITGNGMLSLLTLDPDVKSLEDLRGKTIEVAGQGASPDYVLKRILRFYGFDPERDLTLSYSLAYPEIAQSLIAGRVSTALLPEPFATMALTGRPGLKVISDIQEEWKRSVAGTNSATRIFPMTLLVVNGVFADENPAAVEKILDAAKNSIEWVTAHPAEAGQLAEKHELGISAAIAAAAIPKSNYVFIPAIEAEAKASLEALLGAFLENDPVSIGGALPEDKFYFKVM